MIDGFYIQVDTRSSGTVYILIINQQNKWIKNKQILKFKARLISSNIQVNSTSNFCFSLWYYMYGAGISSLNIYRVLSNGVLFNQLTDDNKVFSRTGTQGKAYLF